MISRLDGWSVVLAGHWNRMIFSPDWVNAHLFHQAEIETFVSILPNLPLIYQCDAVRMEVSQPRIIFRPRRRTNQSLQSAENFALTVLQELDDTPLSGVGINFHFVEDAPPGDLTEIFNIHDNQMLVDEGFELRDRRITRQIVRDGTTLNFTLLFQNGTVTFEFNYHTDTTDNAAAQQAVTNRVVSLYEGAIRLLENVYHLRLPAEGE